MNIWIFYTQSRVLDYTRPKQKIMDYLCSSLKAFSASSLGEIRTAPGKSLLSVQTGLSSRQQAELEAVVTLVSVTFTGQNARSCCNNTHIFFLSVLPEGETVRLYTSATMSQHIEKLYRSAVSSFVLFLLVGEY